MGTNYYLHRPDQEPLHIGKSSVGWCFGLHVTEEVKCLADWIPLFNIQKNVIRDAYDRVLSSSEMLQVITERHFDGDQSNQDEGFMDRNHAERGPNGLLRCKGAKHEGTCDLIEREFS